MDIGKMNKEALRSISREISNNFCALTDCKDCPLRHKATVTREEDNKQYEHNFDCIGMIADWLVLNA